MQLTFTGTVVGIVFYNQENGYTVLELETQQDGIVTCVGNLPSLSTGEVLTVTGTLVAHKTYGEQLQIETYVVSNPTTKQGIIRYLASGLIKGVGPKTAENIYNKFGDDSINVIEADPSRLATIKGISINKAMEIGNSIAELKKMQEQIMFLQKWGMTTNLALKIYNVYKQSTKAVLSQNPYKLIDDVDGVGFATADKIAVSMGHDLEGEFRLRAAIVYALKDTAEKQGNTYLPLDDLFARCNELVGLDFYNLGQIVQDVLTKLVLEPTIKLFDIDGKQCIALVRYYSLEHAIATKLLKLNREARPLMLDADVLIDTFQKINKFTFHEGQLAAVKSAVVNGVTVITGGPGTGKTTIIKCIGQIFSAAGLRVEFCAPTGRASKRLSQSTGKDAKTIHRLLGYEFSDGKMNFKYNQHNTLHCDVVVVDEVSMVDVAVMHSLLRALEDGSRIVLVGDKDQLPSVGAGNVLADVIKSRCFDVKYLTYVYRQSEDSLIVSNAHLINAGKMPEINNSSRDFFFTQKDDLAEVASTVVQLVATRLPKFTGVEPSQIQVMGALKSGVAGVESLNVQLQSTLNPFVYGKGEIVYGKTIFRQGDRVMQTVNNYELAYVKPLPNGAMEEGQGVFNGDIGFVTKVDKLAGSCDVTFDDGRVACYAYNDLQNLQLAYAITVHKSQGSEFDVVVVPLLNGPPTIINKNLLYTAITRAKKVVVLVGSKRILAMMIHNNYVAARTTLLRKFLQDEKLRFDKFFASTDD
ncbi:MAG: ATP-dependent RecD-like DNA helicase [Clostridia bacterium]|nr:ATP-dependent RecD-like DNA helicase [Clostridia bacterium]